MPNWTYNKLVLDGDANEIKNALDFVKSADSDFDFDKLIPAPKCIKDGPSLSGEYADDAVKYYKRAKSSSINAVQMWEEMGVPDYLKEKEAQYNREKEKLDSNEKKSWVDDMDKQSHSMSYSDMMKNYLTALQETGCVDWYTWNCKNWGVKWNASDVNIINDHCVSFYTPWDSPTPIFHALIKQFPSLYLEVESEFEDGYLMEATYYMDNGEVVAMEETTEIKDEYNDGEEEE